MGWTVWGSNPSEGEIFRSRTSRPWGPPSLLYNGYRVIPAGMAAGVGVDHPPPFSAEVKERVELHLYYSSGCSWPVIGRSLPFTFLKVRFCVTVLPIRFCLYIFCLLFQTVLYYFFGKVIRIWCVISHFKLLNNTFSVHFRQKESPCTAEQMKSKVLGRLWLNSRGLLLWTIVQFVTLTAESCRKIYIFWMTELILDLILEGPCIIFAIYI